MLKFSPVFLFVVHSANSKNFLLLCMRRRWEGLYESNPQTTPFEDWVRTLPETEDLDVSNPEEFDKILLCTKPSQRVTYYCRMKAFGNHFRVEMTPPPVC
jgi:hypothetical protein